MTLEEAIEIVMDLARENVVDQRELPDIYKQQMEAIAVVEDHFVNTVWP